MTKATAWGNPPNGTERESTRKPSPMGFAGADALRTLRSGPRDRPRRRSSVEARDAAFGGAASPRGGPASRRTGGGGRRGDRVSGGRTPHRASARGSSARLPGPPSSGPGPGRRPGHGDAPPPASRAPSRARRPTSPSATRAPTVGDRPTRRVAVLRPRSPRSPPHRRGIPGRGAGDSTDGGRPARDVTPWPGAFHGAAIRRRARSSVDRRRRASAARRRGGRASWRGAVRRTRPRWGPPRRCVRPP